MIKCGEAGVNVGKLGNNSANTSIECEHLDEVSSHGTARGSLAMSQSGRLRRFEAVHFQARSSWPKNLRQESASRYWQYAGLLTTRRAAICVAPGESASHGVIARLYAPDGRSLMRQ